MKFQTDISHTLYVMVRKKWKEKEQYLNVMEGQLSQLYNELLLKEICVCMRLQLISQILFLSYASDKYVGRKVGWKSGKMDGRTKTILFPCNIFGIEYNTM